MEKEAKRIQLEHETRYNAAFDDAKVSCISNIKQMFVSLAEQL